MKAAKALPAVNETARIARLVEAAEEGLRRRGFTERTIRDQRRKTRALIEAHIAGELDHG